MTSSSRGGDSGSELTASSSSCSSSHTSSAVCEELRRLDAEEAAAHPDPRDCWLKVKAGYKRRVLVGNWFEEEEKIDRRKNEKMLPSEYDHYYGTTYKASYNQEQFNKAPRELKNLRIRHAHAFPCHQPELDSELLKAVYNSWETSGSMYCDPVLQADPPRRAASDT